MRPFVVVIGRPEKSPLQYSILVVIKVFARISAPDFEKMGCILAILWRWERAVRVMNLMCDSKVREGLSTIPRFKVKGKFSKKQCESSWTNKQDYGVVWIQIILHPLLTRITLI